MSNKTNLATALIAVALSQSAFATHSATAADLGGNCCADLEERIAELEATTARKGNRKVSLTITGWVSSQIFWFDDSIESNVYVVDNTTDLSSNVKFTGSAQISPGWKAGYSLWLFTGGANGTLTANENGNRADSTQVSVENSYWFIQSDKLGKLSVGKQSLAADNAALGSDFSGTLFPNNSVFYDGANLGLVLNGASDYARNAAGDIVRWGNAGFYCEHAQLFIGNDCAGARLNGVRYDTPTFAGFTLGASWGEDDYWDVALRYSGEFSGFKMAFATAYSESTDANLLGTNQLSNDSQYFQIGGMIKHLASGLWIHGTYGLTEVDNGPSHRPLPDQEAWYLKAGWTTKFSALGSTHLYGEYSEQYDSFEASQNIAGDLIAASDGTRYGLGVVQDIDAAAMSLWAKWRHHELDVTGQSGTDYSFEDVDLFLAGAVIFY